MPPDDEFYEIPYPSSRQLTFDLGKIGLGKHHVKGLLEIDVTEARTKIKQSRHDGKKISFFAWLVKSIADCVAAHPSVNGFNHPSRNKVVLFKDVDVSTVVEKIVDGVGVPLPYVIRKADQKSIDQIQAEIELAKSQMIQDEGNYVLGNSQFSALGMKLFISLPQSLRLALMRLFFFNNPKRMKAAMGTVMITTAGMAGHPRGWIIPFSMHPICLALGSLNEQPAVFKGAIQIREILHLTILIDHDVIDGIPAARFVDDLVKKLQTAYGL